jgi:hypothetical protein
MLLALIRDSSFPINTVPHLAQLSDKYSIFAECIYDILFHFRVRIPRGVNHHQYRDEWTGKCCISDNPKGFIELGDRECFTLSQPSLANCEVKERKLLCPRSDRSGSIPGRSDFIDSDTFQYIPRCLVAKSGMLRNSRAIAFT